MHLEILDNKRLELLKKIAKEINFSPYYMAGGTGLSLQMDLRKSYDFDFFVPEKFSGIAIYSDLETLAKENIKAITVDANGTCDCLIDDIQISFFFYPYKMISPLVKVNEIPGLFLADIPDIAAMKLVAIGNRGSKKDFFDLYHIITRCNVSPETLVTWLNAKCGKSQNLAYIAMGLNYFDDAEGERMPECFAESDWEKIKIFFEKYQKDFSVALSKAC